MSRSAQSARRTIKSAILVSALTAGMVAGSIAPASAAPKLPSLPSLTGVIHPLLATVCMLGSSAFIEWWSTRILSLDYSLGKRRGNNWWTKRILTLFSQDNS